MDQRRLLAFASLTEVMPEVDRLLRGHRTLGRWSLAQICNHLAAPMIKTVDGFGGRAPWLVRKLVAPPIRRKIFREGRMTDNAPLAKAFRPEEGLDDRAEAEALRATIGYLLAQPGPYHPHPFFGAMTVAEWHRYHAIHCAHHLGFVVPA